MHFTSRPHKLQDSVKRVSFDALSSIINGFLSNFHHYFRPRENSSIFLIFLLSDKDKKSCTYFYLRIHDMNQIEKKTRQENPFHGVRKTVNQIRVSTDIHISKIKSVNFYILDLDN